MVGAGLKPAPLFYIDIGLADQGVVCGTIGFTESVIK